MNTLSNDPALEQVDVTRLIPGDQIWTGGQYELVERVDRSDPAEVRLYTTCDGELRLRPFRTDEQVRAVLVDRSTWHPAWCHVPSCGATTGGIDHWSAPIELATTDLGEAKVFLRLWQVLDEDPATGTLGATITFEGYGPLLDVREYPLTPTQLRSGAARFVDVATVLAEAGDRGGDR